MEFHEKLLMLRRKKGVTQQEAADALGVSRPTYGGYESGKRHPQRNAMYQRLADYFGVAVDELFPAAVPAPQMEKPPVTATQSDHAVIAHHLAGELAGLFAGGKLSDEDKEAVMRSLERAYWLSHPDEKPPQ